jgi:hypothetical protein
MDPPQAGRVHPVGRSVHRLAGPIVWTLGIAVFLGYSLWCTPLEDLRTPQDRAYLRESRDPSRDSSGGGRRPADPRSHQLDAGQYQRLLSLICEHALPVALFGVVLLIVAGRLGRSLGLPGLFRDPPRATWSRRAAGASGPAISPPAGVSRRSWVPWARR